MTAATPEPGAKQRAFLLSLAGRIIPGINRVRATVEPFAEAWRESNAIELERTDGPLWIALGDSMTQGVGARDIGGGWVSQLRDQWAAAGHPVRLVNLSVTGARSSDVLHDQLPKLRELNRTPDLVTVLVGANDMALKRRRAAAVGHFRQLLTELEQYPTVMATLPRGNTEARAINAIIEQARVAGGLRVAELRGGSLGGLRGTLADDHFHPNEVGYARLAKAFSAAIDPPF